MLETLRAITKELSRNGSVCSSRVFALAVELYFSLGFVPPGVMDGESSERTYIPKGAVLEQYRGSLLAST